MDGYRWDSEEVDSPRAGGGSKIDRVLGVGGGPGRRVGPVTDHLWWRCGAFVSLCEVWFMREPMPGSNRQHSASAPPRWAKCNALCYDAPWCGAPRECRGLLCDPQWGFRVFPRVWVGGYFSHSVVQLLNQLELEDRGERRWIDDGVSGRRGARRWRAPARGGVRSWARRPQCAAMLSRWMC